MVSLKGLAAACITLAAVLLPSAAYPQTPAAPSEISPAGGLKPVPRNETLILGWSIISPVGVTNPWAVPGYTHQEGNNMLFEPLMFYGIFNNKYIPWLASSMKYTSKDFTSLEIKLNPKATWNNGEPVTSKGEPLRFATAVPKHLRKWSAFHFGSN